MKGRFIIVFLHILIETMASYRLDRTAFKAYTANDASRSHAERYKKLTWQERCRIANFLNSIAFNYNEANPPRLDRTKFIARSRENG